MKILVACEESQVVCKAFRERGHESYSCDIQLCSGGLPEWHIVGDFLVCYFTIVKQREKIISKKRVNTPMVARSGV